MVYSEVKYVAVVAADTSLASELAGLESDITLEAAT